MKQQASRRKLVGKTIGLGLGSVAIYAASLHPFTERDEILHQGRHLCGAAHCHGVPVSFVHGAFASNLWSCLGIEATKKVQPRMAPSSRRQKASRGRQFASMLNSCKPGIS